VVIEYFNQGGEQDLALASTAVAAPFFGALLVLVARIRADMLLAHPFHELTNYEDLLNLVDLLFALCRNRDDRFFEAVLRHFQRCQQVECQCRQFFDSQASAADQKRLLGHVLQWLCGKFKKEWELKHLLAWLKCSEEKCHLQALHTLLFYKESKLNLMKEFCLFRLANQLRRILDKQRYGRRVAFSSFETVARFNESVLSLQRDIKEMADRQLDYYKELMENKPRLDRLLGLAVQITAMRTDICSAFKELLALNRYDKRLKKLYTLYF
jgi:hypothetical protein